MQEYNPIPIKFLYNAQNLDCTDLIFEWDDLTIHLIDKFGNIDEDPIKIDYIYD